MTKCLTNSVTLCAAWIYHNLFSQRIGKLSHVCQNISIISYLGGIKSMSQHKVFCFYCKNIEKKGMLTFSKKAEATLTTLGFNNWKKALQKFSNHEHCSAHQDKISPSSRDFKRGHTEAKGNLHLLDHTRL